jgi:molybdopterin/thiamine biosynthesis adenylyltransferase
MNELVLTASQFSFLRESLNDEVERGAVLYFHVDSSGHRYLLHSWEIATPSDVLFSSNSEITFASQFLTRCTRHARERNLALGILHTHPAGAPFFSTVDDDTEAKLADFMYRRSASLSPVSLVLCEGFLLARLFGKFVNIPVRVIGNDIEVLRPYKLDHEFGQKYDRQVRAFGVDGQKILEQVSVAIVGVGGTGSVLAQQLAHLGVKSFLLIDPDVIELSNLNRVVGSSASSLMQPKVSVAKSLIEAINADAKVVTHINSALSEQARKLLCQTEAIFMCTDSHSSRAFLSELCHQYLIPGFDVGVSITASNGGVKAVTGRAQMVVPEIPCLLCSNAINYSRIREELMTPAQRAADPYFNEEAVTQPAVISLNSTVVSLAVTMFLGAFTGMPLSGRWLTYDGMKGFVKALGTTRDPECPVCGDHGVTALGDSRKLSFL